MLEKKTCFFIEADPALIDFSNEEFVYGPIRTMQEAKALIKDWETKYHVAHEEWIRVDGFTDDEPILFEYRLFSLNCEFLPGENRIICGPILAKDWEQMLPAAKSMRDLSTEENPITYLETICPMN